MSCFKDANEFERYHSMVKTLKLYRAVCEDFKLREDKVVFQKSVLRVRELFESIKDHHQRMALEYPDLYIFIQEVSC